MPRRTLLTGLDAAALPGALWQDGCFYRFTQTAWGDLSGDRLDVFRRTGDWRPVSDPSPGGSRLCFSSQRGTSGEKAGTGGITYEVKGPFRR